MIRRAVIGLLALVLLLLILTTLLLYGLVGTAPGNRWLLARTSDLIPGDLQMEQWQGNLLSTVDVTGLRYETPSLTVEIDQLKANLTPLALVRGWLTFEFLTLGKVNIQTAPTTDPEATPSPLPESLALPLGIRIEQLAVDSIQLNQATLMENLEGESLSAWRRFQFARLDSQLQGDIQVNVSGHGQLTSPYPLDGQIRWQKPLPDNSTFHAPLASGELKAKGPVTALQLEHTLQQPLVVHSHGQWLYEDDSWQIDLLHEWQTQTLPLSGDRALSLGSGKLQTRGPLSDITLNGTTTLQRGLSNGEKQTLSIALDSQLAGQTLTLHGLTLRHSKQRLSGKGSLQLQPLQWDLTLNGDLDTGIFSPQWKGILTIDGHSKGRVEDNRWQLDPGTVTVTGTLREQRLKLKTRTWGDADNLQIEGDMQWGDNQLQAAGKVWPQWQLQSQLSLGSLSQLLSSVQGSLEGTVQVRGETRSPRLSGQLNGTSLAQGSLGLSELEAHFDNLGIGPQTQKLTLAARGLTQDSQPTLASLNLTLDGTLKQHSLVLALQQDDTRLRTRLDGALLLEGSMPASWQGSLHDTLLSQPQLGQWQQAQPSPLNVSSQRQQLGEFCLQQQNSHLCLNGSRGARDQLSLNARLNQLPLALASSLLGPDYSLDGTLSGHTQIQGTLDAPEGNIHLQTEAAMLTFNVAEGPPPWKLDTITLDSELKGKQAQTRLTLATTLGRVDADLSHGFHPDKPMDGQVSFQIERLSVVEMLTADLRDVSGTLKGDIQLAGTPRAPLLNGNIALEEGHALIPSLGIAVSQMSLALSGAQTGKLNVSGQANMGDGVMKVNGYLDPSRWPLSLNLHFTGQRLLVADRPDARVWLTPDLTLKGDLEGLLLSGKLLVPEAAIHPEQLPEGAVTVSEDQVLVHQEGDASQRLPLAMDVTVTLGDKVNFNGFGLNADLGGSVQILQHPQQPPQLNGELVVRDGRYRAYGQNLAISDGQLIFQGQPDNPGLDIRAYRKIPSEAITVGVQLAGTLQSPEATLYSDPSMEPSQIMSYLLTGRPLEGGTQNDANRIAQALAVYGLEKGSGVTDKIGSKLGVDEITVGSDWETEDAALMLGKQLSDRLYLTYAIGLFDAVSTVMLRYTLTRSLHLEARSSSEANSLDLIWEKELR